MIGTNVEKPQSLVFRLLKLQCLVELSYMEVHESVYYDQNTDESVK